jgi:hypothetical protein
MPREICTIVAAAIRDHDGTVYSVPRPGRHHHVIRLMVEAGRPKPITGEQGFVLEDGRFVNREEGAQMALASGQIEELHWPPDLFSEDLW